MCGLFFSAGYKTDRNAIECVAHRGPDALIWKTELWNSKKISMGHARLKIIDLSDEANQPFEDRSKRFVLMFNGAIYNHIELRQELEFLGYGFRTCSDTEVLLNAFLEWDKECLPRLSGMFAFVLWDRELGRGFAARDRYGIKPLFITTQDSNIAFASEIKQLLTLYPPPPRLNIEAAFDFLEGGLTDHMRETLFETIWHVQAGEYLDFLCDEMPSKPCFNRWYNLETRTQIPASPVAKYKFFFSAAIKRHLRSDVAVGACLSGGLDSSSIVMEIDAVHGQSIQTFTAGSELEAIDETRYAKDVISKTEHVNFNAVRPSGEELAQILNDLVRNQDEPFGSSGIYSQWCVFRDARSKGIVVMLDGQGADELLAGYHAVFPVYFAELISKLKLITIIKALRFRRSQGARELLDGLKIVGRKKGGRQVKSIVRRFTKQRRANGHWLDTPIFAPIFETDRDDILGTALKRNNIPNASNISNLCRLMIQSTSLPRLLRFEDRNAMAHGIEARVPFLDNDFSEFVLSLPTHVKLKSGQTKSVLRQAMTFLPNSVLERKDKLGFATPQDTWLRGPLKTTAIDSLEKLDHRFPALLSPKTKAQLTESLNADRGDTAQLWRVVIFGLWAELYDVQL